MTNPAPSGGAPRRTFFVRSLDAGAQFEIFFISAVATILIVRAALAAAGWPQLGGGKLHVAHMLWGGLGMLIGFILLIALEGRLWGRLGALAGGIGFGLFIDELGKFITSDNDYFFKPTMALIYLVFVGLYFLMKSLTRIAQVGRHTALVNAFDYAKEAVLRDLDDDEKAMALQLVARSDPDDPVVPALRRMLEDMPTSAAGWSQPFERLRHLFGRSYAWVVGRRWFKVAVIAYFLAVSLVSLAFPFVTDRVMLDMSAPEIGEVAAGFVTGALVLIGILRWRDSRLAAYRWFERAALVTILIGEFFAFYQNELSAVYGLVIMLLTWGTLRYMIGEEQKREQVALSA